MIKIKEAIIVEGRYDKIKLSSIIDTVIIETNGFRVFKDKEKQCLIRQIAQRRGILIMTDSDSAGFVIRNFLKGTVPKDKIKHCYIPQISGKEKRKEQKSKEGFLGVEGLTDEIIIQAVKNSGVSVIDGNLKEFKQQITKTDFFELGLSGQENSKQLREKLLRYLNLPLYMTANAMLSALNCLMSIRELEDIINLLNKE